MAARESSPLRVVGVGLVALALLVVASLLQGWLPEDDEDPGSDPHLVTGEVGQAVDLRTAEVTVERVSGAPVLLEYGTRRVSPALWVLVEYTVVAAEENTQVGFVELEDADGRTWGLVARNNNGCWSAAPGVPSHCRAYFEVPADAVPTLRLRMARDSEVRYDVMAEVDLELTGADAEAFAATRRVDVPSPSVGGGGS